MSLEEGAEHQQTVECLALRLRLGGAQQSDDAARCARLVRLWAPAVAQRGGQPADHVGDGLVLGGSEGLHRLLHVAGEPR